MEKEIIVHIGTPKTGSSSLQIFLACNQKALNANGWSYPDTRENFNNPKGLEHGKWANGGEDTFEFGILGRDAVWKKEFDLFIKVLENSLRHYNVLLSDEGIWDRQGGTQYINFLKERYGHVRVVVYLRRQDMRMESEKAQKIKRIRRPYGIDRKVSTLSLKEYCDWMMKEDKKTIGDICDKYNYFDRLLEFEEIVGKENLLVHTYEEAKKVGLLCYFVKTLGLQYEQFHKVENINITPSVMDIEIKRRWNMAFAFQSDPLAEQIESEYWDVGMEFEMEKGYLLSPKERRQILEHYAEGNMKVAERYFHRQSLFSDEVDYPQVKLDEAEVLKNYTKVLEEICIHMSRELSQYSVDGNYGK